MTGKIRYGLAPILVGVFAWLAAACAPALAVVGPSLDGSALAPFVVMVLNHVGATAGFCSGIVVSRDAVLTAAHCVPVGAELRVHFRGQDGAPVLLPVIATVVHPGYRADAVRARQRSIDLALVRVATALPDRFRPATLSDEMPTAQPGTPFRVAGFGVAREREGASSGQLRTGAIEAREPLSDVLLWARDPQHRGTGACTGDSGGPVFKAESDTVVAVTLWSAGDGKARCGALTQALWLAPQRAWIEGILARWAP